jgi:hypothetical protein
MNESMRPARDPVGLERFWRGRAYGRTHDRMQLQRVDRNERSVAMKRVRGIEMERRSFKWVALVAIGLAGVVAVSAATALAGSTTASAFELTLEGKSTWEDCTWEDCLYASDQGTFRSRAPFCATGTFVHLEAQKRFTCDDGTGSLTVWFPPNTEWRILDGSGSYAGLRGRGWMQFEKLGGEGGEGSGYSLYRSTFEGTVDWDAVAPTIDISSAKATKLRRPAGAYSIRLALSLGDNVAGNTVAYKLRVTEGPKYPGELGRTELASKEGSTASGSVSTTLRVVPSSKRIQTIYLRLSGSDPIGNEVSLARSLKLPR